MDWFLLVLALLVILAGSEIFTNGVEWIGKAFGLSEGVVGSVLAAVGTALPETVLPFIAILISGGAHGKDIGVGAILGAPFMLSTLALFVFGVAVLIPSRRPQGHQVRGDRGVVRLDLTYFLLMYGLATIAGLWHFRPFHYGLAAFLVLGYAYYVRRHFKMPGEDELAKEAASEVGPLYLQRLRGAKGEPPQWLSLTQAALALGIIVGGAKLFIQIVNDLSDTLAVPALAFSLLLAPVATELPEKFNSVIWARRGKDTLAMGNITGAMVFQSSFPVSIGLVFTPWRLSGEAVVAAFVALAAAALLYTTVRRRGFFDAKLLLLQGILYVGYVTYVVTRL